MNEKPQLPVLRLEGDLFFTQRLANKTYRIQVTSECLADIFGSDGSLEADIRALQGNIQLIVTIAARKIMVGTKSPIRIRCADFRRFASLGADADGRSR
ncbi:hypothetical protein QCE49_27835 [Caballeronia sp. LZ008]|jgi:hypothetical protein|uniref:hypothetical protein n=1 Tax=unclassified Caballeronia TaxID=2646786 RepID=UPI002028330F|nr:MULTISPECIES: hypothetical protein [unclassified Caballeronia]MDR5765006.1 hypothetical protein [Caballeronia sp. LZ028]MDR5797212.1 hypothetical protein [Caballeronia sp. LZ008]